MIVARRAAAGILVAFITITSCRTRSNATDPDAGAARTCATNTACAPDEYCAFEPHLCGKGARPGVCRARPMQCPEAYAPVCGCDGKIARSECDAHAAGIDLDVTGACRERVPAWSACGAHLCDARTSYCEIILSDVVELPTDYTCKPLPAACLPDGDVARKCSCFPAGTRCSSFCGNIPTGTLDGLRLTCRL
jgi:hypothetical protein